MLPLVNVIAIKKFNNKKPQEKDEPDGHNRRQFPDLKIYDTRSSTPATSRPAHYYIFSLAARCSSALGYTI